MKIKNKSTVLAYAGIIAVVFIWGVIPLAKKALIGNHFSPAVYSSLTTFAAACVLLAISAKSLRLLNRSYFKVAIPTGLCVGIAALLQAIAYKYDASPTKQAFLENLSCVVVPILLFIIVRKRPHILTVAASLTCLAASFVLSDIFSTGLSFGVADILNALAGIFYGVNIAFTGVFAKKFNASLYVMIQLFVQAISSMAVAVAFNFITFNGAPMDKFIFTPNPWLIIGLCGIGILTNAICWTVRTVSMKYVSANVVAVIMPFSAVVTGIFSVIFGMDTISPALIIGAALGLAASFMSAAGDIMENNKNKNEEKPQEE
jgi:drug/metabolite transporter (DMT)-like permease